MVYLDYSATTMVNDEVLDTFNKVTKGYIGNPNSLHKLGLEAKKIIDASTKQIANILNIKENEIIYTSGATEANNAAIYGILNKYQNRGKEIITTKLEHSSINENIKYIEKQGYKINYVKLDNNGKVDLEDLSKLLNDNTVLVTIASVNSEIGIHQSLKEISNIVRKYPKCIFHSDLTQSIGKIKEDLRYIDLGSFSSQKFYGLKGVGVLIKKENIDLLPLIKGGKSTTVYRAGTPSAALIASTAKALRLAYQDIERKYENVNELNSYLRNNLKKLDNVEINSPKDAIPHILNISVLNIKPETLEHALEIKDIYISTKTACATDNDYSEAVYTLTNDLERSKHSVRISLSYLTTKEEINSFINALKEEIENRVFNK